MFSVVIPVYNHERYLVEAVESALESELVKEVLLVDDGSRDGSVERCRFLAGKHPRVKFFPDTGNIGAHNRLNELCRVATQPWISVLNSDDRFLPGRFEELAAALKLSGANFAFSALEILDSDGRRIGGKRATLEPEYPVDELGIHPPFSRDDLFLLLVTQNYIATTSNMVFHRELFQRIGGFGAYRYVHDWDFALRAFLLGEPVYVPRILTSYRVHPSNTIKESLRATDEEITKLFSVIEEEFSHITKKARYFEAKALNRHILSSTPREAKVPPPAVIETLSRDYSAWMPDGLTERERIHAEIALRLYSLDFVILTGRVLPPGVVEVDALERTLVASPQVRSALLGKSSLAQRLTGRIVAVPGNVEREARPLREILPLTVTSGKWVVVNGGLSEPVTSVRSRELLLPREVFPPHSGKRRMLVLPIYMAVGGVERNTIEIMRRLKDEYEFIVATFDDHQPLKATLHHQVEALGIPVIDFVEVAERSEFNLLLEELNASWDPEVLWICNGCSWLVENAWQLRRIFKNAGIVDQEVYDDKVGWVNAIPTPGIQSFDRFVATNSRIQRKFVEDYSMDERRIDLIYPAIDSERFAPKSGAREEARAALQLPHLGAKNFAFVGRLTEQKQPLRFLELVRRAKALLPDAHFIFVGDGELRGMCQGFIAEHELTNLTHLPFCEDPSKLWQVADALVMTSIFEGLPIVSLEALAMGRPVFATDVGDLKLVLEAGNAGRIVPVEIESDALWNAFQEFSGQLSHFTENALKYSEFVRTRFGVENIAAEYRACFLRASRRQPQTKLEAVGEA